MNSRLAGLQPYPFQKLAELIRGLTPPPGKPAIRLSMGEPQHAAPPFVLEALRANLGGLSHYPVTKGSNELRQAIARWANRRFKLDKAPLDPERHVLPCAGTREALFSIAQAVIDQHAHTKQPATAMDGGSAEYAGAAIPLGCMPNPVCPVHEGAG